MKLKLKMQKSSDSSIFFEIVDCKISKSQLGRIFDEYKLYAIEKGSVLLSLQFLQSNGYDDIPALPRRFMKGSF